MPSICDRHEDPIEASSGGTVLERERSAEKKAGVCSAGGSHPA
jgi:hypothetical protein